MTRTWGRLPSPFPLNGLVQSSRIQPYPAWIWVEVSTDSAGYDDYVYITALVQTLRLNLGESPFWGNFGIPAKDSIMQQIAPDYFVAFIQQYYAPHFASLIVSRDVTKVDPTYNVQLIRNNGSQFEATIAI